MSKCNQHYFYVQIVGNGVIVSPSYGINRDSVVAADEILVFGDLTDFLDWARDIFPSEE